jgi:hypothetical protein
MTPAWRRERKAVDIELAGAAGCAEFYTMRCNWLFGSFLVIVAACQAPERAPLRPLPDDGPPVPYAELLTRARAQCTIATEAFYVNKWDDVEDAARGLEQTAHFLPKAEDVPAKQKESLAAVTTNLNKDAVKLREAAKAKDEKAANEVLQRLHLTVRELRLDK